MSVKSKLKTAGKFLARHAWSLGVSYLLGRYVEKKAGKAVTEALHGVLTGDAKKVPPGLQPALEELVRRQIDQALERTPPPVPRGKK